ncbi:hypothetical protein FA15DRAFT_723524 [Coprinopsis marcescibilis]|uniref:Uncharacterized protein n=1 Tax=Coprinopsis marcescibilis TaxID=230819 RepID=A0A5C3KIG7_COPMA|nr:hypothetical protein FA15DRAFT_723524 [Coprinopsis marcescibilis]
MSPVWTQEYANEYGLVYAKGRYADYVLTMGIVGVQLFMNSYALIIFLETPSERRQGRALYLVSGWLIFTFYTIKACTDMARMFQLLLEASNGIEFLEIYSVSLWMDCLSALSLCFVFVVGDGLLLYRCYLLLAGSWLWLLSLPVLMYLSTIGLNIISAVLYIRDSETLADTQTKVGISLEILTFATNFLITTILCYRMLSAHRDLARMIPLAGKRLAVYQIAIRILVESALPLTISGIIYTAVTYIPTVSARHVSLYDGDPKALVVAYHGAAVVYFSLQALAPQIIIFRVTTGRSWTKTDKSSNEALSQSLAFAHDQQPEESNADVSGIKSDDEIAEGGRSDAKANSNVRFNE